MPKTNKDSVSNDEIELYNFNNSKITKEEITKLFNAHLAFLKSADSENNIMEAESAAKNLVKIIIDTIHNDYDDFLRKNLFSALVQDQFCLYIYYSKIENFLHKKNGINDISENILSYHKKQSSNLRIYVLGILIHISICLEKLEVLQALLSNLVEICDILLNNADDYQCVDLNPLYQLAIEKQVQSCFPLLYEKEKNYPTLFKQGAVTTLSSIHILHSQNTAALVVPQLQPLSLEKLILNLGNAKDDTQPANNGASDIQQGKKYLRQYANKATVLASFNKALQSNVLLAADIAFIFHNDDSSPALKEAINSNLANLINKLILSAKNFLQLYDRRIVSLLSLSLDQNTIKILDENFALHEAAARKLNQAALALLMLSDATINIYRKNTTVLHITVQSFDATLVKALVQKNANVKFALPNGITALHEIILTVIQKFASKTILVPSNAEINSIIKIIEILLDAEANINAKAHLNTELDITPLHLAIRSMVPLVVSTILKRNPDITIENSVHGNVLDYIKELIGLTQQNTPPQLLLIDYMLTERVEKELQKKEIEALRQQLSEKNNTVEKPMPSSRFFPHI